MKHAIGDEDRETIDPDLEDVGELVDERDGKEDEDDDVVEVEDDDDDACEHVDDPAGPDDALESDDSI